MSEQRAEYRVCTSEPSSVIVNTTELDILLTHLPDIERLLTSLLIKVQVAQGKEPTVLTRAQRRKA